MRIDSNYCLLISQGNSAHPDVFTAGSLEEALKKGAELTQEGQIFVLGGSAVYEEALRHPNCKHVFITKLTQHPPLPCDALFPGNLLKAHYHDAEDITMLCYETLKDTLPKSAKLEVDVETQSIIEHGITFKMHRYCK